jgi:hypothetical protein
MGYILVIEGEQREKCLELFGLFDELKTPDDLKAFAITEKLIWVKKCVPNSNEMKYDRLLDSLLRTGKSVLEPALFDLLNELTDRHKDFRAQLWEELKEELRKKIPHPDAPEDTEDYQGLANSSAPSEGGDVAKQAEQWIEAASDNLDELALRITLAVFNGTAFEEIEKAHSNLLELLQELLPPPPPPDAENPLPPPAIPVRLMRRLKEAGAREADSKLFAGRKVIELDKPELFASEAINYVWQQYREKKWRQKLIEWLTSYAAGHRLDVRTRAAVTAGRLAIQDYHYVKDNLLRLWVRADNRQSEYRTAIGMALGVLVLEGRWAGEVQDLLKRWSQSEEQPERWAAARAYIYVGAYCRSVSDVIAGWRAIAASEKIVADIPISGNISVRLTNPLHMSLVDAMMRFFFNIAQRPEEERRSLFKGVLEGLKRWIGDHEANAGLGLFMFTMLGQLPLTSVEDEETDSPPVLLQLIEVEPAQTDYRKQLAELFELIMRNRATRIEAKELLCAWLNWADGLQPDAQSYESRIQTLLTDIIATDNIGRMRWKLTACLRDCGRKPIVERLLAHL